MQLLESVHERHLDGQSWILKKKENIKKFKTLLVMLTCTAVDITLILFIEETVLTL